jgi:hypothetical protein
MRLDYNTCVIARIRVTALDCHTFEFVLNYCDFKCNTLRSVCDIAFGVRIPSLCARVSVRMSALKLCMWGARVDSVS